MSNKLYFEGMHKSYTQ